MAALFVCPHCLALGLTRRQMPDHVVFECQSCGSRFPTERHTEQREKPVRRDHRAEPEQHH